MPATGASTTAIPRGSPSIASARPAAGVEVVMSIHTAPWRSAWNAPPRPIITASTCGGPGSIVTRTSHWAAVFGTDSAAIAPASTSGSTASARTSNTTTSKPARRRLSAIGAPIRPSPMNPTTGRSASLGQPVTRGPARWS